MEAHRSAGGYGRNRLDRSGIASRNEEKERRERRRVSPEDDGVQESIGANAPINSTKKRMTESQRSAPVTHKDEVTIDEGGVFQELGRLLVKSSMSV